MNVPTRTAQLKEILKMIQKDEHLNYMTIITSLNNLLNIAVLNNYKISQDLSVFFESVQ